MTLNEGNSPNVATTSIQEGCQAWAFLSITYTTDEIDKTFVAFSAIFHGAIDLVAKRGVSAGSVTGEPIQFLPI
jgi:hypothetical protein